MTAALPEVEPAAHQACRASETVEFLVSHVEDALTDAARDVDAGPEGYRPRHTPLQPQLVPGLEHDSLR